MKQVLLILLALIGCAHIASAQRVALKTNLVYGAVAYAPNLGVEVGLGQRTTLDLSGGYNPWNRTANDNNNKKLVHWLASAEFRYWFCERFNGWFVGAHALGGQYNIGGHNLPLLFGKGSRDYRYEGYAYGGGVSAGYQFILGRRWNLELNLGVGYARMEYDRYRCPTCGKREQTNQTRNYFGPTRAGVNLVFFLAR